MTSAPSRPATRWAACGRREPRTDQEHFRIRVDRGEVSHELAFPPPESVAPIVVRLASGTARHLHGQILSLFIGSLCCD